MRKFFISLLVSTTVLFSSEVLADTIKDNSLTFDSGRVAQDEKESLGEQSNQVMDLFNEEDTKKLAEDKDGKASLSRQQGELFQKGKVITTSLKRKPTNLFQSSVTHVISIDANQDEEEWNLGNTLIYGGVILLAVSVAGIFTYRLNKSEKE
ncbi:type VII secretion protein EssA [Streptococcus ferus]|uniref:Type VII secretion protein EssA n=1 Tax=Streptococcus ferus TaxID=1345 RepID=A0A2X3XZI4_9STRE|nr:type VII secretion protein EssA [Streptococcus ferus]SQF40561.1 type VII secretion protein EssA [Streptococcus ferus]